MQKKEILLITKTGKNFGAVLQAYALVYLFKRKNFLIKILNHPSKIISEQFTIYRHIHSVRDLIYNLLIYNHNKSIIKAINRFQEFRNKYFHFTEPYETDQDVINNPPNADLYVVGSDQVWNPNIRFSPINFLQFGNNQIHRYSYSASIGIDNIPVCLKDKFKKYLSNFNGISVRESSAVEMLNKININSINTVDPTLLLSESEWEIIANDNNNDEKYILVYTLYNLKILKNSALKLKKITGYKIKFIATSVRLKSFGDEIIWDAGPREFVSLIKNASYIVTSSYHGMLFSINFKKPFFVILPESTQRRFLDFLRNIDMDNRIIKNINDIEKIYDKDILKSNTRLEKLINFSKKYLNNIL